MVFKKKYYIFLLILVIFSIIILLLSVLTKHSKKTLPPEIEVSSGNIIIESSINKTKYKITDLFKSLMTDTEIPYIKLNDEIIILINGDNPDFATLEDILLDENGDSKVNTNEIQNIPIFFQDNKSIFKLPKNIMSMSSSNSTNYESGKTFRGFRLTCSWKEKIYEYIFVLRSDAY